MRGAERFFAGLSSLLRAKREPEKHPLLSRRGRHEKGAARPFQTPKELSKPKNASRFAKTGCGAQRPLRALSGTRVLLTAAPTAPPCIRRRRRSSLLRIFCASPIYGSADDFTSLLDVTVSREVTPAAKQQVGETRKKRLAQRLAFFRFDFFFGIVKGEQPLTRCGESGVQR